MLKARLLYAEVYNTRLSQIWDEKANLKIKVVVYRYILSGLKQRCYTP